MVVRYPVVLDAVVQSMAIGFVGTDRSTFSIMGRRRVSDWNRGAAYALTLLVLCLAVVLVTLRLFRVNLTDVAK